MKLRCTLGGGGRGEEVGEVGGKQVFIRFHSTVSYAIGEEMHAAIRHASSRLSGTVAKPAGASTCTDSVKRLFTQNIWIIKLWWYYDFEETVMLDLLE